MAIRYHDHAVSLLVGVFDDGDVKVDDDEKEDEEDHAKTTDDDSIVEDIEEIRLDDDGVLLSIRVNANASLFDHGTNNARHKTTGSSGLNALADFGYQSIHW